MVAPAGSVNARYTRDQATRSATCQHFCALDNSVLHSISSPSPFEYPSTRHCCKDQALIHNNPAAATPNVPLTLRVCDWPRATLMVVTLHPPPITARKSRNRHNTLKARGSEEFPTTKTQRAFPG